MTSWTSARWRRPGRAGSGRSAPSRTPRRAAARPARSPPPPAGGRPERLGQPHQHHGEEGDQDRPEDGHQDPGNLSTGHTAPLPARRCAAVDGSSGGRRRRSRPGSRRRTGITAPAHRRGARTTRGGGPGDDESPPAPRHRRAGKRRAEALRPRPPGSAGVVLDDQLLVADDRDFLAVRVTVQAEGQGLQVDLQVARGLAVGGVATLARDLEEGLLAAALADHHDVVRDGRGRTACRPCRR